MSHAALILEFRSVDQTETKVFSGSRWTHKLAWFFLGWFTTAQELSTRSALLAGLMLRVQWKADGEYAALPRNVAHAQHAAICGDALPGDRKPQTGASSVTAALKE